MESLALMVAIIVAPAMFGGPIALCLSLWQLSQISTLRRIAIFLLSIPSIIVGLYLLLGNISPGAMIVGTIGFLTAVIAIWRVSFLLKRIGTK